MTAPQQPARLSDPQNLAKAASAYAGLVFGIYWIPLRALELAGFPGIWAGVALNLLPCLLVLPAIVLRGRRLAAQGWHFHCGTLLLGLAYALYASAFLFTQVINVIVLYYLLPLWGFLLARLFTGERITPVRWLSMALGFLGILVILGPEQGIPLPTAAGDWMALASGFLWAAGSLLLLLDEQSTAFDCGIAFIFWGTVCAAAMAIVAMGADGLPPSILSIDPVMFSWLVPVALLIVVPAGFATVYGPMVLNPGVVGLLFMTEISVGTITAAVLTDEPFGIGQALGIAFVSTAGLLEIVWHFTRKRLTALRQG